MSSIDDLNWLNNDEPVVKQLDNGLMIGNFDSSKEYTFETGEILPGISVELERVLQVDVKKEIVDMDNCKAYPNNPYHTISYEYIIDKSKRIDILYQLTNWEVLHNCYNVDIVLCNIELISFLFRYYNKKWVMEKPFRAPVYEYDKISTDKFRIY